MFKKIETLFLREFQRELLRILLFPFVKCLIDWLRSILFESWGT